MALRVRLRESHRSVNCVLEARRRRTIMKELANHKVGNFEYFNSTVRLPVDIATFVQSMAANSQRLVRTALSPFHESARSEPWPDRISSQREIFDVRHARYENWGYVQWGTESLIVHDILSIKKESEIWIRKIVDWHDDIHRELRNWEFTGEHNEKLTPIMYRKSENMRCSGYLIFMQLARDDRAGFGIVRSCCPWMNASP